MLAFFQLSRSYTPFGEELAGSGSYETPFGFAGEMQDASGLLYLRARYLSTETGRFTSVDAFSGYLNYPASMNPYQYAYINPLKYVDPSGNIVISALQWAQVGMDLYSMVSQYADRNCTTVEQLTRNVLAGVGSVAAGIAVGAVVGALGVALFPGSLLAAVAFGALGGAMAGQYARLVSNLILGRDPTEGMYNPRDMLVDGILGGIGGAAGFLSAKVLKATGGGLALALGLTVSVDVGIGELAYAANQRLHGEEYEFSWQRVALNAAISTVTFGIGYGIGKVADRIDRNVGAKLALAARDKALLRISQMSSKDRGEISTVVGGVNLRTAEVTVGIKRTPEWIGIAICAEDLVVLQLGGDIDDILMTTAIRPRTGEPVDVCARCQTKYKPENFINGYYNKE